MFPSAAETRLHPLVEVHQETVASAVGQEAPKGGEQERPGDRAERHVVGQDIADVLTDVPPAERLGERLELCHLTAKDLLTGVDDGGAFYVALGTPSADAEGGRRPGRGHVAVGGALQPALPPEHDAAGLASAVSGAVATQALEVNGVAQTEPTGLVD